MNAFETAEAYQLLREALEDNFEVTLNPGKGKNQGKLSLKKRQPHGMDMASETLIAMELGRRRALAGESLVDDRVRASTEPLRKAFDELMTVTAINKLGKEGIRGEDLKNVDRDLMKERAWNMLLNYDRGYNPETGAPYGLAGTDGGHKLSHHNNPELSTSATNIMPENKYENRVQGDVDDPQAKADRLANGLIKRIRESTPAGMEYSDAAKAEMAAGPPIMRMNRKQYLKAKRLGQL